ncbi:MHS family MFS transporter [Neobacillus drentensis]|uniref:MFS transporter n=1 Tax=Neobacillus drentensis TaxID=220684 RepID=UPI001F24048D|nr:MFS transporter [Neobacillus drentensis]ULT58030.1 MHS family MFS transporter [Neobacillus drentensis]
MSSKTNQKMRTRAAVAATIGSVIEWYDFFLYATASALIFPKIFFPSADPYLAMLQSFGAFAIGFIARPIGAAIFGHFGDRIGRKTALVLTMFLMGLSSLAIGLLPTYDKIGLWAPTLIVILRLIQGIGVGGEWGGSVLLSMEWGQKKRQALMASWPQMGVSAGLLVSSIMVSVFMTISGNGFYTWGWRIPFLFSFVLLIVGLIIRAKIPETPSFQKVQEGNQVSRLPVLEVIRNHPKEILLAALVRLSENGPFYVYTVLIINYAMEKFTMNKQFLVNANTAGGVVMAICIPLFGYLADKFGIRRMYLIGVVATLLWAFPYIRLINTGVPMIVFLATALAMIPHSMQVGPQGAFVAKSFPARLRYSGLSLGSQLGSIIAGGIAPLICTFLLHQFGTTYAISFYIIFAAIITFSASLLVKSYPEQEEDNAVTELSAVSSTI